MHRAPNGWNISEVIFIIQFGLPEIRFYPNFVLEILYIIFLQMFFPVQINREKLSNNNNFRSLNTPQFLLLTLETLTNLILILNCVPSEIVIFRVLSMRRFHRSYHVIFCWDRTRTPNKTNLLFDNLN